MDKTKEPSASEVIGKIFEDLEHHGIKGMHWGVRRTREQIDVSTSQTPGKRVSAKGGQNQPAHADAITAATHRQKAKASTTDSLSNAELQALVTRMNLEAQYNKLTTKQKSRGQKWLEDQAFNIATQEITARGQGKDGPATTFAKTGAAALKIAKEQHG